MLRREQTNVYSTTPLRTQKCFCSQCNVHKLQLFEWVPTEVFKVRATQYIYAL